MDAPENGRNVVIEHKKYKFLEEDPQTLLFSSQIQLVCAKASGTEDKIGASQAPQKRLEWENLLPNGFCRERKAKVIIILNIYDPSYMF